MPQTHRSFFPQDFQHKLINFSRETLANLFKLAQEAVQLFAQKEFSALDPLVCENACHIRAFALRNMVHQYQKKGAWSVWQEVSNALEKIIQRIQALSPINERNQQTIAAYLLEHQLFIEADEDLLLDIKFIFLSRLLTLTKKQCPSSTFMLHEKTCLTALQGLGLVHNKIKGLVSSAQKELSAMSCQFIQIQSCLTDDTVLNQLLMTRYDDHHRSYLPQYSSAKVILIRALQTNTPLIIKLSRFVQGHYHDEIRLGFKPSTTKKDYSYSPLLNEGSQTAIICEGVIDYAEIPEHPRAYLNRLNSHSLFHVLLANFAAHPQFSGNLRHTPCLYKEALAADSPFKPHIAQEWEEFNQHAYFAKKEGCTLENPHLLFLNHVFCDLVEHYCLSDFSNVFDEEASLVKSEL